MDHTVLVKMGSRILLLLFFTSSVCEGSNGRGVFQMSQTQSIYRAMENEDVFLEWTFTETRNFNENDVHCEHITDDMISVVLHTEQGVQDLKSPDPRFAGRVQFDAKAFRDDRLRIHMRELQTEDSGLYRCEVVTYYGSNIGTCRLRVSAAASETQTLRPGPERPGPEGPGPERPGPERPKQRRPGPESVNKATRVTCLPFGIFILLLLLL